MLIINSNLSSLKAHSQMNKTSLKVSRGFERLSSGLRINSAKDDAAGLQISTRMSAHIRGVQQASRNALDGMSYLQTAEGALGETTNILQRMRELVVQAGNEIISDPDRTAIQNELGQLRDEINRINGATEFNGQQIFSQHKTISVAQSLDHGGELNGYTIDYELDLDAGAPADFADRRDSVIANLQSSWLRESEKLVEESFGLTGNGAAVRVTFDREAGDDASASALGGFVAFVASSDPQRLHIDLHDFPSDNQPHGGNAPQYSDRILAHEFVHLAMNANNIRQSGVDSKWFNEGAAELVHGAADTRLAFRDNATIDAMVADAFNDDPINYGGAYIAAAYLHDQIQQNGGEGVKDFFSALKSNGNDYESALGLAGYANHAAFATDFAANGSAFGRDLRDQSEATGDTGSLNGSILGGGAVLNQEDIVPNDVYSGTEKRGGIALSLQIGADEGQELNTYIGSFNADALGLTSLDVTDFNQYDAMLYSVDDALNYVSNRRSEFGALQNRLESTINSLAVARETTSASRARIRDADIAHETSELTQAQIIQQASVSVLSQANASPQLVLSLLG